MKNQVILSQSVLKEKYPYGSEWVEEQMSISQLMAHIESGGSWGAVYAPIYKRRKDNFVSTNAIVFNIKSILSMDEYIAKMQKDNLYIPTFAYTPTCKTGGMNSFKLVYCFQKPINKHDIEKVYNKLSELINFDQGTNGKVGSFMTMTHCGCTYTGRVKDYHHSYTHEILTSDK